MTQKEGINALLDGKTLVIGVKQYKITNFLCVKFTLSDKWGKSTSTLLELDFTNMTILKPKPKPPKYFMCWAVNKNDNDSYGPICLHNKDGYSVNDIHFLNKESLLNDYWIHDKDDIVLNSKEK